MDNLNVINFPKPARMPVPPAHVAEQSSPMGPIEQKMRAQLAKLKGSKYPDSFDWGIYDKIAARFGDKPPRGGVIFNTNLKLINNHLSCTRCHYALEIDSYGRGCIHDCQYCYAKELLYPRGYWNNPIPFPIDLSAVRKIFFTVFETNRRTKWRDILQERTPLRIGSMSDSFMWMDRKYKVSQELLKILNFYKYPYIIATKSDLVAEPEYLKLIDPKLASVQISVSGGHEKLTKLIEPGTATVARRLLALRVLAENDIWTAARINPLFPIYPDGFYTDPASIFERFGSRENAPKFDLFDWSFIDQLRDAKVPTVIAGFVRMPAWGLNNIHRVTGINLKPFFRPGAFKGSQAKTYSDPEIAFYYKKIQSMCAVNGMRFSNCYIGNGVKDYFQYQDLWNNKTDCCDTRGNVASFKTSSQDISWETRIKFAQCKESAAQAKSFDHSIGNRFQSIAPGLRTNLSDRPPNEEEIPNDA